MARILSPPWQYNTAVIMEVFRKKLGGELVIRRNGDMIIAGVRRSGAQLVEATMKLETITVVSLIIKERMHINGKLF